MKNPASAAKQSSVKRSMESDSEDSLTNSGVRSWVFVSVTFSEWMMPCTTLFLSICR